MEQLPRCPGNSFTDVSKQNHHISQTLDYKNGFRIPEAYPTKGTGGDRHKPAMLTQSELDELANFNPVLTYGKAKQAPPAAFVPAHVVFEKRVLRFFGYFKETVHESQSETYRVRHIMLLYFLEDDSISLYEPQKNNSGIPQGKLLRRQRVPKNDIGEAYHWRDLNVGQNFAAYGRVYRLTNCDKFTKDFLESQGVDLNQPEQDPIDPYLQERQTRESLKFQKTPSTYDARRQHLENDRKVLRFYAIWDDRSDMFGECRKFCIHYYLADDTIEVAEQHEANSGRDPFPLLIKRSKIPKSFDKVPRNFPSVTMEYTDKELQEYFTPRDLKIGSKLNLLGRKFLIIDCDNFTKAWYYDNYGVTDFTPIDVSLPKPKTKKMEMPPYNGFGSLEDSLAPLRTFIPQPSKTDIAKFADYGAKCLRYACRLESPNADDKLRKFILSYRLGNDTITIQEVPVRNSGFPRQTYLHQRRIPKPESTDEQPIYYGPADFHLGARIKVYGARFVIEDVDEYVVKFMEMNRDQFPDDMIACLRKTMLERNLEKESKLVHSQPKASLEERYESLLKSVRNLYMTWGQSKSRLRDLYRFFNPNRLNFVDATSMKEACDRLCIPNDEDATKMVGK